MVIEGMGSCNPPQDLIPRKYDRAELRYGITGVNLALIRLENLISKTDEAFVSVRNQQIQEFPLFYKNEYWLRSKDIRTFVFINNGEHGSSYFFEII